MTRAPASVSIHYLRPPNRRDIFIQRLVLNRPGVKVTLAENLTFDPPIEILGEVALETGSDAVWFTFPGTWHDIGRFHRANDTLTGIYANILTPPVIDPGGRWETTDLFLDVWIDSDGELSLLDEDQLDEAESRGWVSASQARRAREEAEWIRREHAAGRWPPPVVERWTLDVARQASSEITQAAQRRARSR